MNGLIGTILIAWALGSVPLLTADQSARLAGAVDGTDQHDEAFLALVEHVRAWMPAAGTGDAPIRLRPDFKAMLDKPAEYRGELCRVSGALQQSTNLAPPFDTVWEWFVRNADGTAAIIYVVNPEKPDSFHDLETVEIDARFYKRMNFVARDGKARVYPAFVGAFPRRPVDSAAASSSLNTPSTAIAIVVIIMAVAFVALMIWARSGRRTGHHRLSRALEGRWPWSAAQESGMDDAAVLPDDPASALEELKRRAAK